MFKLRWTQLFKIHIFTPKPLFILIIFGKSSSKDYTFVQADDIKRKSHTVRVEGLSRYTKYRFVVVGLGPVGMQFPSQPIEQRTKLFF